MVSRLPLVNGWKMLTSHADIECDPAASQVSAVPVHHPETFFEDAISAPMFRKFSTLSLAGENHGGPDRMFPDRMATNPSAEYASALLGSIQIFSGRAKTSRYTAFSATGRNRLWKASASVRCAKQ
jgi:hypothetical protein